MKTIKVSDGTHKRLLKISGEIQAKSEEKTTMEKAIRKLIEKWEK